MARREARRKYRLRLRKLGYLLFGAILLGIVGTVIALKAASETPVQTVVAPDISSAVSPPKPAPKKTSSEPVEVREQADSGLAGDPAALKKRVEEIANYYGGAYGVEILDPSTGKRVSLGAGETFFAASIGKLPALLSLYEAAANEELDLDDGITMYASDVQSYGTGVLHNNPVGTTISLRESAYYLMNQSDNTAWAMLTRYLGIGEIQSDLYSIGANDTTYWEPNNTTAGDVLKMLRKVQDPSFTSQKLSEEMITAMTDTEFEDRIPAGLPQDVRVAHKIGTYENSFSDAGVVFYEGPDGKEHHYFIVVLTEGAGEANARAAIQEISAAAHETFAAPKTGS